jgi:N6-L-threonylcarbamoyladenine synthase
LRKTNKDMKKKCFVGFDTSNYTTSVAVCDYSGHVVANLKAPLPVKAGERGLRQSDAVFAHIKNLPALTDKLQAVIFDEYEPIAVGVSSTPRDAEGSYMPCFLSGVAAAHSFAAAMGLPIYEFSHQSGHIMAAAYSSGEMDKLFSGRFIAFHVSGGTTEALLVTPSNGKFTAELVGETLDINAGQLIDRIGVLMGLSFPCGAALESLAAGYGGKTEKTQVTVKDGRCNLSGFENKAVKLYEATGDKNAVAAYVFDSVCRTIIAMGEQLIEKYGQMPILFAGGVMSNKYMRETLKARFEAYFSEPAFSADNAAGISILCKREFLS